MSRKRPGFAVRPAAARGAVERFVSGSRSAAPRKRATKRDEASGRALVERADGRSLRRMTIYLPEALAKKLRTYCAVKDVDISDAVAEAVGMALA